MTEFAVLGRHLMKDQKSHNLCIITDIQQLLMNLILKKQYEVLKLIMHSMWQSADIRKVLNFSNLI